MVTKIFDRPVRFTEMLEKWEPGSDVNGPPDSIDTVVAWFDTDGTPITNQKRITELNRERDAERATEG